LGERTSSGSAEERKSGEDRCAVRCRSVGRETTGLEASLENCPSACKTGRARETAGPASGSCFSYNEQRAPRSVCSGRRPAFRTVPSPVITRAPSSDATSDHRGLRSLSCRNISPEPAWLCGPAPFCRAGVMLYIRRCRTRDASEPHPRVGAPASRRYGIDFSILRFFVGRACSRNGCNHLSGRTPPALPTDFAMKMRTLM
jgi:hypothetical protein